MFTDLLEVAILEAALVYAATDMAQRLHISVYTALGLVQVS